MHHNRITIAYWNWPGLSTCHCAATTFSIHSSVDPVLLIVTSRSIHRLVKESYPITIHAACQEHDTHLHHHPGIKWERNDPDCTGSACPMSCLLLSLSRSAAGTFESNDLSLFALACLLLPNASEDSRHFPSSAYSTSNTVPHL